MTIEKAVKNIREGIAEADDHLRRADVIRENYYKELARLSLSFVRDRRALFSCLTDRDKNAISELMTIPNGAASGLCMPGATGALFARYCTALCERENVLPQLSEMFPRTDDGEPTTAALVTGGFADLAFSNFREELAQNSKIALRPHHADRVQNACDSVLDGEADFAIIPIWNDRDGRLRSFYRMMDDFDLKILSVTTVATEDGRTRFALCGVGASPLFPAPAYLEFSAPGKALLPEEIGEAMRTLGHTVTDASASPSGGGTVYHFAVSAGGDLRSALLYLNIFDPNFSVVGLYGNLYEKQLR